MKKNASLKIIFATLLSVFIIASPTKAEMEAMSDKAMESVTAQSGFSAFFWDINFDYQIGSLRIYDTDSDRSTDPDAGVLEFQNYTILNGYLNTETQPVSFDIFSIVDEIHPMDGHSYMMWTALDWQQNINYSIDGFLFCGHDIGSLFLDEVQKPSYYMMIGSHGSGIDFEYGVDLDIGAATYQYNTSATAGSFNLSNIKLAQSFSDMDDFDINNNTTWDIPTDTSLWEANGLFVIGDIDNGNPATIDIGYNTTDAFGAMRISLPMAGSIRVENLEFGSRNFGPCAIDGLQIHRLDVYLLTN